MTKRSNSRTASRYERAINRLDDYLNARQYGPWSDTPFVLQGIMVASIIQQTLEGLHGQSVVPEERIVGWTVGGVRRRHHVKPVSRSTWFAGIVEAGDAVSVVRLLTDDGTIALSTDYAPAVRVERIKAGLDTNPVLTIMTPDDLAEQLQSPEGMPLATGVMRVLTELRNRTLPLLPRIELLQLPLSPVTPAAAEPPQRLAA